MLITTRAIVFGTIKYGEADLIASCYTEKIGLQSYLLRGVLKTRKGKLRPSLFQPLSQLELVASHRDRGSLEYLREARLISPYQSLHSHVVKSTVVFFLAEMLRNSVREEEQNQALYQYLETALNWFDAHDAFANFHLLFLLKLTKYLGFYPDDTQADKPVFDLMEGKFQDLITSAYCIFGENKNILSRLLGINFDALSAIKLNQTMRSEFLSMLLKYFELHLQDFRKPRSLAVLNEIFS